MLKLYELAPAIAASLWLNAIASAQLDCGMALSKADVASEMELQAFGNSAINPHAGDGTIFLPLTFHVVRRNDGTGGLVESRIAQAMTDANNAFASMHIQFCRPGPTIFIDSDEFYFNINTTAEINALRMTNPAANTINIYCTPNLANESGAICGISSFTYHAVQGIVMHNNCTGAPNNPSTFPHEIGHYFNLYHTHETAQGVECVNGSNCTTAGDLVCDTPADPTLSNSTVTVNCVYVGTAVGPCVGDGPFTPDVTNFMSSSRPLCRHAFTAQQGQRATATLLNLRPKLVNACPPAPIPGDATGDGQVNVNDLLAVINSWGPCNNPPCAADFDGNLVINVNDLLTVINNWT